MTKPHDISAAGEPDGGIDAYLEAVQRGDCYRAIRPLGATARARTDSGDAAQAGTKTELVLFEGANGARLGPFVRKRIDLSLGIGSAYEELYRAQRAGARYAHLPGIVECYKTGRELVVISEYVPGETLDAYVGRKGASETLALSVLPALCAAVGELHGAFDPPLVHRDLKPSNVVVHERAKGVDATLIDFGIARRWREGAPADTARFGTRAYAPPEQFGFGQTTERSDVYALGMIALFCATGREPQGQPTASTLASAGLGDGLVAAILRATSFDPARRFASAAEFATALLGEDRSETACTAASVCRPAHAASFREHLASARPMRVVSGFMRGMAPRFGLAWNGLLAILAVCFSVVATQSLGAPLNGIAYPMWYSVYITYFAVLPLFLGALYLLLARRCMARLLPRFARRPRAKDVRVMAAYFIIVFLVGIVANAFV